MPKACVDDQAQRIDLALQERIGGNRGAMGQADHAVRRRAGVAEDFVDPAEQADRRVARCARDLGDIGRTRQRIDRYDVGERSAGVDADSVTRRGALRRHALYPYPSRSTASLCRPLSLGWQHGAGDRAESKIDYLWPDRKIRSAHSCWIEHERAPDGSLREAPSWIASLPYALG